MERKNTPPWNGLSLGPIMVALSGIIDENNQHLELILPASETDHHQLVQQSTELGGHGQGLATPCLSSFAPWLSFSKNGDGSVKINNTL